MRYYQLKGLFLEGKEKSDMVPLFVDRARHSNTPPPPQYIYFLFNTLHYYYLFICCFFKTASQLEHISEHELLTLVNTFVARCTPFFDHVSRSCHAVVPPS